METEMKINHNSGTLSESYLLPASISRNDAAVARGRADRVAVGAPTQAVTGDRVSVSHDARLLAEGMRAAQNSPDIHADRVASLRQSLANGSYPIDARRIAYRLAHEEAALFRL